MDGRVRLLPRWLEVRPDVPGGCFGLRELVLPYWHSTRYIYFLSVFLTNILFSSFCTMTLPICSEYNAGGFRFFFFSLTPYLQSQFKHMDGRAFLRWRSLQSRWRYFRVAYGDV
jgi:hypothetical protein